MYKAFKTIGLVLSMLSIAPCVMAQESESTNSTTVQSNATELSLSLDQAVKYALEHNRTLKNASLEVQKAEMQRWQTIAQMLLQIDGTFQYTNMFGQEMNLGSMPIPMNPYGQMTWQATAGVSAQGIIGAQMQRLAKEIQEINVNKSEQQTKYDVESNYVNILALEETANLLNKNMENLNSLKSMIDNAVKVGVAEQNDADQISIQVASMLNGLNSVKRSIEALYNALILSIGADSNVKIKLTQTLDDVVNDGTILSLTGTDLDLNNNLDYQMLMKSSEISDKQKKMAVAAFFPTVGVAYQNAHKHYFGEAGFDMTPTNTFVATVNVPVFSSGKRTCAVKEAKIAQQEQANTIEQTEIGLKVQEKQLKFNLTSAYENYNVQKENIRVMSNVFNSYGEKLKYGKASSMDITNSSINLVSAQTNYINAVLDMVNANISLKKLLNK